MIVKRRTGSGHRDASYLLMDKLYSVYAVMFGKQIQCLVNEERSFSFPIFVSLDAVDVVDTSLPEFMHFSPELPATAECSSRAPMIGFFEIVSDRFFYQRLVDGDARAEIAWGKFKALR